ncbi:MAG: lysophospholipid acyltransferase family protein, partial [Gelidibacter sp.]
CDHFIETLKLLSINEEALHKRITVDYSEIERTVSENINCHVYLGHQFNWEWANAHISSILNHNIILAYKPITNPQFDKLMRKMRERFGSKLVSSKNMKKEIQKIGIRPHILILVADQNPKIPMKSFWTTFLSQKTAFQNGPEIYTASTRTITFFANIVREKRGYYKMEVSRLFDFSEPYKMGLITQLYARKLEESIINNPENYLWSHRRWKHEYKDEYIKRSIESL